MNDFLEANGSLIDQSECFFFNSSDSDRCLEYGIIYKVLWVFENFGKSEIDPLDMNLEYKNCGLCNKLQVIFT